MKVGQGRDCSELSLISPGGHTLSVFTELSVMW